MEVESEATLLSAVSKPYDFAGNKGVSNRVRFSIKGEIFDVRSTGEQVASLISLSGKTGIAKFVLVSPKEKLAMKLISFEV